MNCLEFGDIKTGDLLAWSASPSGEDIWIKLVRLLTMSNFGHVSVAWVIDGRLFHVEAVIPKIQIKEIPKDSQFYYVPMPLSRSSGADMTFFNDKVGMRYSFMDALRAFLGLTTKSDDHWQCAELVHAYYESKGVTLNARSMTPTNIVDAALEHSQLFLRNSSNY